MSDDSVAASGDAGRMPASRAAACAYARDAFMSANAEPMFADGGGLAGTVNCIQDITKRERALQRRKLLIDELNHRVKNMLATVRCERKIPLRHVK